MLLQFFELRRWLSPKIDMWILSFEGWKSLQVPWHLSLGIDAILSFSDWIFFSGLLSPDGSRKFLCAVRYGSTSATEEEALTSGCGILLPLIFKWFVAPFLSGPLDDLQKKYGQRYVKISAFCIGTALSVNSGQRWKSSNLSLDENTDSIARRRARKYVIVWS